MPVRITASIRHAVTLLALFLGALCGVGHAAGAQAAAPPALQPPQPDPAFPKLFPRYSGLNGYEDLVAAADLIQRNEAAEAAEKPEATLQDMRKALEDRNVDRALQLLRAGLDKPIESPRDPDKLDENTLMPELPEMRALARLLAVQEYVYLADGQVGRAIDTLRDGLRLGYVVQTDLLIGGLVGIAIDQIVLTRFAEHFDEMALRDCIHLVAVAHEWLKSPRRTEGVLTREHRALLNMLEAWKSDPQRLRSIVKMMQPAGDPASGADIAAIELNAFVNMPGAAIPAMLDETRSIAEFEDRKLLAEIRKPVWERKPAAPYEQRATMATRLYGMISPTYGQALGRFDVEAALIHLLGVHAAIRRYRWEHGRLPSSLADLELPAMIIDPFTGGPLLYKLSGATFELSSAGAIGPVTLPRKVQ
ncbi:MAG TPA: hypothetical protein VKT77_19525 [Chthonomonadaceae bacterium]|nr:hypothetical protein [Chthonomonadaceae bacterium]